MNDTLPPPPPPPVPPLVPSLGAALPNWAATLIALATAIGGLVTAYQSAEGSRVAQRAAYEALRRADADKSRQLVELAQGQLELRSWIAELSARLEERAEATEKTLRKVARPKTPLPPPPAPAPPPPPAKTVTPIEPLPPFEQLEK